ncbi:MAG: hypothetical protein AAB462_02345 [Patescibacteria group bacterium]
MLVLLHVVTALSSVAFATYLLFRPSAKGVKASYALVALTLSTGTYLVWLNPSHLLSACTSGLLYTLVVSALIATARRRMALQ